MAPALADGAGETRRPSFAPRNAGDIRNAGTIAAPPFADEVDPDEEAFLWESVREGDQNALWDLLVGDEEHPPCGLPVDCTDAAGMTPLHWLTVEGHDSVAQWLIDEVGATVDAPDARHGLTALHFAATKGKATAAGLLLRSGADPVRRDSAGWTPLHAAARSGYLDVCHTLLGALLAWHAALGGRVVLVRHMLGGIIKGDEKIYKLDFRLLRKRAVDALSNCANIDIERSGAPSPVAVPGGYHWTV